MRLSTSIIYSDILKNMEGQGNGCVFNTGSPDLCLIKEGKKKTKRRGWRIVSIGDGLWYILEYFNKLIQD